LGKQLFNPHNTLIDLKLVGGAFSFGLGWGIGGLCPGPALMQFSIFTLQIQAVWFASLILGMHIAKIIDESITKKKEGEKNLIQEISLDSKNEV
jgi:hypothetical protein